MRCIISIFVAVASCGAFSPCRRLVTPRPRSPRSRLRVAARDHGDSAATEPRSPSLAPLDLRVQATASAGLSRRAELPRVLGAIADACAAYGVPLDDASVRCDEAPWRSAALPGVLGRVLLLKVLGVPSDVEADEDDLLTHLKIDASERIDAVLNGGAPVLLAFRPGEDTSTIGDVIEQEVADYGLRDEVDDVCQVEGDGCFVHPYQFNIYSFPSSYIEIDGCEVEDSQGDQHFDTSSILIFDKILDKALRKKLLNIVKGHPEDHAEEDCEWDDVDNGPDPNRWTRGGLVDVLDGDAHESDPDEGSRCWGLTSEAVMEICYNHHPAIAEFESILIKLFPDFIVTRLPEAVLGDIVSPLTANAPTCGDAFAYHIDADPLQVPPSPWADVFGRYPNRRRGQPRFVSCLLYLDAEWDAARWGAPTQFLDPPTGRTYEVFPKPGRCVIMDQDITHRVVAPAAAAGQRPRYSLVLKLVLHPKVEGQDMDLSCGRHNLWPEPTVVGSANRIDPP